MTQENSTQLHTGDEYGLMGTLERNPRIMMLAGAVIIIIATSIAYLPAIHGQFIWDDDYYVTNNRLLRDLEGLQRIWFDIVPPAKYPLPQYYPMTHTSLWVEYHLGGLNPTGYHITNLLLHIANALLIWLILRKLQVPGAWAAAAMFALHPINVESVAWIAERKNVLAGFFFFSSLYIYLRYSGVIAKPSFGSEPQGRIQSMKEQLTLPEDPMRVYALALLLFFFALASKTITSTLPAVVVLLIWWKRGRLRLKEDLVPLLPFFAMSMAAAALTGWMEVHRVGARGPEWDYGFLERCLIAGRAAWFYVGKLIFPYPLIFNYPRWDVRASDAMQWIYPIAMIAVVLILWLNRKQWGRAPLVAMLYYLGTLFPAMGFFNVFPMRYSFVADHFAYLSTIGLIALATAASATILPRYLERRIAIRILCSAVAVILVVCLGLTNAHSRVFQSAQALWTDTLEKSDQKSWLAANNYGETLLATRDPDKIEVAEKWFYKVLRLNPSHAEARFNLGLIAELRGEPEVAVKWYRDSLDYRPNYVLPVYRIGVVLAGQGNAEEAEKQFKGAIALSPHDENAHLSLAVLLEWQKKYDDAIKQYEAASEANPESAAPYIAIGNILARTGRGEEAMRYWSQAARIEPNNATISNNVGALFAANGYYREAQKFFEKAISLRPNYAEAHRLLGYVQAMQGETSEARRHFEEALKLDPKLEKARANLEALNEGRLKPATTQATQPATAPVR